MCPLDRDAIDIVTDPNLVDSDSRSLLDSSWCPFTEHRATPPKDPLPEPMDTLSGSPPRESVSEAFLSDRSHNKVDHVKSSPEKNMPFDQATPPSFTSEQVQKFKEQVEDGYDIIVDHDFVFWLRAHLPSYLPEELNNPIAQPFNQGRESPPSTSSSHVTGGMSVSQSLAQARMALSDVSEFLVFPSSSRSTKSKPPGSARVLTIVKKL